MTTLDDVTTCAGMPLAPPSASAGACLILISTAMPASIGKAFPLEPGEHVLGRGSEAGIRIDDHGVSRRHARVIRKPDGACQVTDLGSTNGTTVKHPLGNRERMRRGGSLAVVPGTRVDIGDGNIIEILAATGS